MGADDFRQLVLVRIADHQADARQRRDLFRRPLRVTARDYNLCTRILPQHPADGRARILIRPGCNGAGVHYHDGSL